MNTIQSSNYVEKYVAFFVVITMELWKNSSVTDYWAWWKCLLSKILQIFILSWHWLQPSELVSITTFSTLTNRYVKLILIICHAQIDKYIMLEIIAKSLHDELCTVELYESCNLCATYFDPSFESVQFQLSVALFLSRCL